MLNKPIVRTGWSAVLGCIGFFWSLAVGIAWWLSESMSHFENETYSGPSAVWLLPIVLFGSCVGFVAGIGLGSFEHWISGGILRHVSGNLFDFFPISCVAAGFWVSIRLLGEIDFPSSEVPELSLYLIRPILGGAALGGVFFLIRRVTVELFK